MEDKAIISLSDVTQKGGDIVVGDTVKYRVIGTKQRCILFVPDSDLHAGETFHTALLASKNGDRKQVCTLYASMIICVCPGFKDTIVQALEDIGISTLEISLPSQKKDAAISLGIGDPMDWPRILVYFGCCILTLFKEMYYYNYSVCMSEMRKKVGVDPCADFEAPFRDSNASAIRVMMGASGKLKRDIAKFVKEYAESEDLMGVLCKYILCVLSPSKN